ncbi:helix-turn-helix domain-containing protein [Fodinibius halophilus]|uniref:Helix-turn-helix transcriptional regulator n=1 Tax=Fodinibius halophilus TaxID=1736908 RepID=A0A6M1TFR6_9BACT|nr:helix-turn-helix transcriptional regulator [Fodinibius halophilus]NGP88972.1 helix-turn-helix transcriptional regulator [Fodinibius halophilus]
MHQHRVASKELSHIVERMYEIDIPHASTFEDNQVIPIGMGTISVVMKGNPRIKGINGIRPFPKYALGGQYFPTFSFDSDIPLQYYGIALRPTATYKLFDTYLAEIQNDFIRLDEVMGDKADQLRDRMLELEDTEERFDLLENFILQMLPVSPKYNHIDVIIDLIYEKQGILKVQELCEHEDISRRYLEKKFKKHIGFTPGQFIRQVRFNFTCAQIAEGTEPVNDILVKFGYYDRSHFMKKFKKYHSNDLSVLTGDEDNLFKIAFSRIMRTDSENTFHP